MKPHDPQIHFCAVVVLMGGSLESVRNRRAEPVGTGSLPDSVGAMDAARPAPSEKLNFGAPTVPRQAATVIVLRGASELLEVLLVKRNPAAHFMGGAWVFPGGAVH